MKAVKGSQSAPQRRILIENEHLVALFDLLAAGIPLERDSHPIEIEFGDEEMVEVSGLIEGFCEAVTGLIAANPLLTLIQDRKTNDLLVDDQVVAKVIEQFIEENNDSLEGIVVNVIRASMVDAVKQIIDELLRTAELFNMKKITIKTRKHALVIC